MAKFLRQNFLRAYYKNRAPFVIHLLTDWLKVKTEIDDGIPTQNRTKIHLKRQSYLNLDGLSRFINDTLSYHNDVYFVTGQEAIEFMKSLPIVMQENSEKNFTQILHEIISSDFNAQGFLCTDQRFDGKCEFLKLTEPDYDTSKPLSLETEQERNEEKNLKILFDLQSESLFVNNIISYVIMFLAASFLLILFYDRFV